MRFNTAPLWLPALLVLAGCPEAPADKPHLSAVTVTCAPATAVVGQPSQCTASASDQHGNPFSVPGYSWTSSDESVATVDSHGGVTTLATGTTTLSASATADGATA